MKSIITSLKIFLVFTILTGIVYPLLITGIAQVLYPVKSNGSLIHNGNTLTGSELIGQKFDSNIYFTSRPSAVSYNPLPSGGSNLAVSSTKLRNLVTMRKKQFTSFNDLDSLTVIPAEMLFASASGLDPHISPEAALLQVERVSNARHFNNAQKQRIIQIVNDLKEMPQFMIFGEARINVLKLNIELNKIEEPVSNK